MHQEVAREGGQQSCVTALLLSRFAQESTKRRITQSQRAWRDQSLDREEIWKKEVLKQMKRDEPQSWNALVLKEKENESNHKETIKLPYRYRN